MNKVGLRLATLLVASMVVSGCGEETEGTSPPASGTKVADSGPESSGLPKLKCPAKTNKSLTGPDIIGVKLGMSYAEAQNVVRCHTDDKAYFEYNHSWLRDLKSYAVKLGPQSFTAQTGDTSECSYKSYNDMQRCGMGSRVWDHVSEVITVAAPGVPGRETVVGVWRTQNFKEGEMPAMEGLKAALLKKYGAPQKEDFHPHPRGSILQLTWMTDHNGQILSPANPKYTQCQNVAAIPQYVSWQDGCGLNIAAQIISSQKNPDVARTMNIGMLHQSNLYAYGSAMQQELDEIEGQRRQEELDRAKETSEDIKL